MPNDTTPTDSTPADTTPSDSTPADTTSADTMLADTMLSDSTPADTMLAVVAHAAGDLRVDRLPVPRPGPGEVAVDIAFAGICGSDLHYYHRGGVGDFTLTEPMVLGHEVSGTVAAVGPGVRHVVEDAAVAIHPATPCNVCAECVGGRRNICRDTRYLGSAGRTPHVQGGMAQRLIVPSAQVIPLPVGLDLRRAAVAEPLAVALHAVSCAGNVSGKRVLVTGAGPIGALVVAALRAKGAAEIIVSDLVDEALAVALAVGATAVVRADRPDDPTWPDEVDIAIEASGAAPAVAGSIARLVRGGTHVQLGLLPPGVTPFPGNTIVTREIVVRGSFRFDDEIHDALALLADGLDIDPVISHVLPITSAQEAFDLAGDRTRASKVLLDIRAGR